MKYPILVALAVLFNVTSALASGCKVRVMYDLTDYGEKSIEAVAAGIDEVQADLWAKKVDIKLGMNGFFRSSKNVIATVTFTELASKRIGGKDVVTSKVSIDLYPNLTTVDLPEKTTTSAVSREDALQKAVEASLRSVQIGQRLGSQVCI